MNFSEKRNNRLVTIIISAFFSFFIFFWGVSFNFIQFRFLIFLLIIPILLNFNKKVLNKCIKYFFIIFLLFLHIFFQSNNFVFSNLFHLIGLFLLLLIFDIYKSFFFNNLDKIVNIFLINLFLYIILSVIFFDNYFETISNNCIGCFSILKQFFKENSHFGMMSVPTLFYLFFISKTNVTLRFIFLFLFILLVYFNQSLTFVAGMIILIFCISFIFFEKKKKSFILFLIISLILIFNKNTFTQNVKVKDIFLKTEQINLSSEVYKASFFVAQKAIFNKPLGYGFNNYHEAHEEFINDFNPYHKIVLELNKQDGSNNFAKIVTEFGVFSLIYFYFLIVFFLNKKIDNKMKIFFITPLLIETFIRGAGYFNGGFLLFFIFAIFLSSEKKLKTQ
jgi:hypothetical protein